MLPLLPSCDRSRQCLAREGPHCAVRSEASYGLPKSGVALRPSRHFQGCTHPRWKYPTFQTGLSQAASLEGEALLKSALAGPLENLGWEPEGVSKSQRAKP